MVGLDLDDLGRLGPVVHAVLRQRAKRPHARTQRDHHIGLGDQLHAGLGALVAQRAHPERVRGGKGVVVQVAHGHRRVQQFGQDDRWSWLLIPLLGFTIAGCSLNAIVYGLMPMEKLNAKFNPQADSLATSGRTHWGTVIAIAIALLIGTAVLMSSLAFSFQRYFEYQIEAARQISQ